MHAHMYTNVYIHTYIHIHIGCIHIQTHTHTYMHTHTHTYTHTLSHSPHTHTLTLTHTRTLTHSHAHSHTHTLTYTCTHILALLQLSRDLQSHAERTPGLVVNIMEARRRLSGIETSDLLSMPHNDLLEGAIVLEEFTKVSLSLIQLFCRKLCVVLDGLKWCV